MAEGGGPYGERAERAPVAGSGAEPQRGPRADPLVGVNAFRPLSYNKGQMMAQIKDLNGNSPPCLRRTASR